MKRLLPLLLTLLTAPLQAQNFLEAYPDSRQFIEEMVEEHSFDRNELTTLFGKVEYLPKIIETITRPAESKPWHQYRPIFLTEERIRGGVKFWRENSELLARAEQEYNVPAQIIVAIIGVETFYGRHKGGYRVMDSLATLGFDYPPRSAFFRNQLKEFLLMAREEQRDPLEFVGSYAGAMGMPQFIPSSFRTYAVDFDGDGRRDLWENRADIIGSVANYFHQHKWQPGEDVASRAEVTSAAKVTSLTDKGIEPSIPLNELKAAGVRFSGSISPENEGALLGLDSSDEKKEYWVTRHNFYVITRYNRSPLYAMAVYQLSEAIRTSRAAELRKAAETTG